VSTLVARESLMPDSTEISVLVVDDEAANIDSLRRIFE
jgi:CheY-like chemotaxis protein